MTSRGENSPGLVSPWTPSSSSTIRSRSKLPVSQHKTHLSPQDVASSASKRVALTPLNGNSPSTSPRKVVNRSLTSQKPAGVWTTKRLPSAPAMQVVSEPPERQSRTVLNETEEPLRRSLSTPQEEKWRSLSPQPSPLSLFTQAVVPQQASPGTNHDITIRVVSNDVAHPEGDSIGKAATCDGQTQPLASQIPLAQNGTPKVTINFSHLQALGVTSVSKDIQPIAWTSRLPRTSSRKAGEGMPSSKGNIPSSAVYQSPHPSSSHASYDEDSDPSREKQARHRHVRLSDPCTPTSTGSATSGKGGRNSKDLGPRVVRFSIRPESSQLGPILTISHDAERVLMGCEIGETNGLEHNEKENMRKPQGTKPQEVVTLSVVASGSATSAVNKDHVTSFGAQEPLQNCDQEAHCWKPIATNQPVGESEMQHPSLTTARSEQTQYDPTTNHPSRTVLPIDTAISLTPTRSRQASPHANVLLRRPKGAAGPSSLASQKLSSLASGEPTKDSSYEIQRANANSELNKSPADDEVGPPTPPKDGKSESAQTQGHRILRGDERRTQRSVPPSPSSRTATHLPIRGRGGPNKIQSSDPKRLPVSAPKLDTSVAADDLFAGRARHARNAHEATVSAYKETKRSRSRGHAVMSNIRGLFHRRTVNSSSTTQNLEASQRPPAMPQLTPISKMSTTPNAMKKLSIRSNTISKSPNAPWPSVTNTSQPVTPAPGTPTIKPSTADNLTSTTSLAMGLLDRAMQEVDSAQKERLVSLAHVMVNAITNARDAERAMHLAQQAAKEAKLSYEMTRQSIGEIDKLFSRCSKGYRF